ncbi:MULTISPECIES: ligand-binding sensor domain-containing diguanylate cyclase [Asticcacaulis]|uniref:ligand-binding sensor domain-containing diguanylate cyclase n=1 Tax=Asticcacaulis TaxID=76890 RepID=UPI001AE7F0BE|nr:MULTISPECIES: ligand-binding sensor domain-containing diguanylate cyclase [Asticcacaulis]MBP2161152.1 diguanylate cyclase (GGDEF)-like protein [Asticcacaulis solisilvae]MDR6802197.1 diguanylate cyclase (GGDEF)-like protein [Asticcacaulis sp. BE141]
MRTDPEASPKSMFRAVVFVLLLILSATCGAGATPVLAEARWTGFTAETFQHVTAQSSEVRNPTSLIQDRHGFLWIGSQNGLVRWDGYRFRLYRPDPDRAGALPDIDVRNLFVDGEGRLWLATNVGGLARYDETSDSFTAYTAGPKGLSHVTVTSMAGDGKGGLWVGTWGGLDHLDPRSGIIQKAVVTGLPSEKIGALLRDPAGNLWIGTSAGLVRRNGTRTETVALPTPDGKVPAVRQIYRDTTGRVWVGTQRHGAYIIDAGTDVARPVTGPGAGDLPNEGVNTIVEVRPGEVWLGTYSHGIVAIDMASMRMRRITHDPSIANSLLFDQVWGLHRDRSGLIWVATGEGLSRYAPEQGAFSVVTGATGRVSDMSEAGALAIREMPDGRLWMGLLRKGVDIVDPVSGRVRTLAPDPLHPETALPQNYVWDFLAMGRDVYIATGQGLYRSDVGGGAVKRMHIPGRDADAYTVGLMRDGPAIWIAGYDGVWRFDPGKPNAKPLHVTALTDERTRVLATTPDGAVWIGTENGLNRLTRDGRVEKILPEKRKHALSAGFVTTLLVDSKGRLWVGTSGGGVDVLTGRDAKGRPVFHHIGVREGLPDPNVDKLLADGQGRIWVSTDSALATVDPERFTVRAIGRESGLSVFNYWVGSGTVTSHGELMFSGASAVLVVRPEMIGTWGYAPPMVISDIRIGKEARVTAPFNGGKLPSTLIVPPGKNLSVEFSSLDFSAPDRNRYRYRLDGFEQDWNETDAGHRVATYTNLRPGRYVLKLQGSNRDGVWSSRMLSIPVRVMPAWYQTWWFYLLAVVLAVVAIAIVIQTRTGVLRSRQRQLEALVEERTAELTRSQAQLEHMAYFDALTGLPNRRMFHEDLRKAMAWARREHTGFSLLLIDLDRFKQVNDSLGHDAGDALLKEAATRLRSVLRENDCVARVGGDEFAIVLMGDGDVDTVCKRIIWSFAAPVHFQAYKLQTSPSIGVAAFPDDGDGEDALYKSADIALYRAKAAGRNTWRYYTVEDETAEAG